MARMVIVFIFALAISLHFPSIAYAPIHYSIPTICNNTPETIPAPGPAYTELQMTATAYCLITPTRTGEKPYRGTVAVDPAIIPLGSRVHVEGYGWANAIDTGGDIRGKRIDVWFPSRGTCMDWGRREVIVKIEEVN
jgi:3D (Asp-Asp-Asp) domain-containing protein